jgi:release factor glutamine methyltransferase
LYLRQLFLRDSSIPLLDLTTIVSHVLGLSKERLLMEPDRRLDEGEWTRVRGLVGQRREGKPLAYITNRREFFSEDFYVDERVLIPRPETELLVEEGLAFIREKKEPIRALDMGTGSGIIGIMLAKGGAQSVLSVDISPGAISVGLKNSRMLGVEDRCSFLVSDLFNALKTTGPSFDLVCANLPYVTVEEYEELMDDVRAFEPKEALVGGRDGMDLYERFVRNIGSRLSPGGLVLCEIGSGGQAEALKELLTLEGFEVMVKNDLAGRQRVVKGLWTSSS